MRLCAWQFPLYVVALDGSGGLCIRNINRSFGIYLNTFFFLFQKPLRILY